MRCCQLHAFEIMSLVILRWPTASTFRTSCVHLELEVSWPWNVGDECLVQRGPASTTMWEQLPLMTPQLPWIDLASMSLHRLIRIATRSWQSTSTSVAQSPRLFTPSTGVSTGSHGTPKLLS